MTVTIDTLDRNREMVQPALRDAVARLEPDLHRVVSYHLGFCDEHGTPCDGSGGKALRSGLVLLAAEAIGERADMALPGAVAVELVHNFSLVHDDLMDRDTERRHRPTVWALWGDATAVLAGDAMLSLAHEVLLESGSAHATAAGTMLARTTRELIRGQVKDLAFEDRDDVGLAECIAMSADKTGSLLAASAAIGVIFAGGPRSAIDAFASYGHQVGIAFQLVDDLLGIWGKPEVTGKPVYSDLRASKKTMPISWVIEAGGVAGAELASWLAGHGPDTISSLRAGAGLVERGGGRDWAVAEAHRRVRLADQILTQVDMPAGRREQLSQVGRFIVERDT